MRSWQKIWTRVNEEEIHFDEGACYNHKGRRTNEWGSPEASGGVVEDLCLRGCLLDFISFSAAAWQRNEDLVGQFRKGLPGQFLLQVVFGWKVPQDTYTNHTSRVSAKVTCMPHFLVVSLIIWQSLTLTCWERAYSLSCREMDEKISTTNWRLSVQYEATSSSSLA